MFEVRMQISNVKLRNSEAGKGVYRGGAEIQDALKNVYSDKSDLKRDIFQNKIEFGYSWKQTGTRTAVLLSGTVRERSSMPKY